MPRLFVLCVLSVYGLLVTPSSFAQVKANDDDPPSIAMSSTGASRFIAAHGSRAVIMGYPQSGLEVWGYPWQILEHYRVGFVSEGEVTETDGNLVLSRIVEDVDSVTRLYTGPGYVVRERLFIPLDRPAAILTYEVSAARPLSIRVHFAPVMNLMWPAATGGQSVEWKETTRGYIVTAPALETSAIIASPDIAAHDETANDTIGRNELAFALRPHPAANDTPASASVYISLLAKQDDAGSVIDKLIAGTSDEVSRSAEHYRELRNSAIEIRTPDQAVNRALAWAEVALDQAWVCEDRIGCGIVAGYGPSRPGRRPQYDWYFAGDGLVAVNALISAGEFARAREELEFIAKYQNAGTGMIWHEQSQSAGYLDWLKLPYMFAHVDVTFDYLQAVARYVQESGDTEWATKHWSSIDSAYKYCQSLVDSNDHLPHIPNGKEGPDEQHRPVEDLSLSSAWVGASRSFAALARAAAHEQQADDAIAQADLAKHAIASHYWSTEKNFWIGGYAAGGAPIIDLRSSPGEAIAEHAFSPSQNDAILDQIDTPQFITGWGVRGMSTASSIFDPWSYATGSVSALHTANTATLFWKEHRPASAWQMWRSIVPWNDLDSLGHIHEVAAGNFYRPQAESVPEQTWSSAGILDAAVRGLLGIERSGQILAFAPHLPPDWGSVSIQHLHLAHSELSLEMTQTLDAIDLTFTNAGQVAHLDFEPQIPYGARISNAICNGQSTSAQVETNPHDQHVKLQIQLPSANVHCRLSLTGGIRVIVPYVPPQVGDAGNAMQIEKLQYRDQHLTGNAEISGSGNKEFIIETARKPIAVAPAYITELGNNRYRVRLPAPSPGQDSSGYVVRADIDIRLTD